MPVAQAQKQISSREFAEWIAYGRVEPWGEVRADWRMATICETVYNINRGKGTKALSAADFLPGQKRHKRMTSDEIMTTLKTQLKGMTGKRKGAPGGTDR